MKKFLQIGIAVVLLFLGTGLAKARPSSLVISEITSEGYEPAKELHNLLPIRLGDPYDPARVDQAVSYLKKWGRFADVRVETQRHGRDVTVRFFVKSGFMVSGIDIRGTYPYLSTRIRRIVTVHSGDLYDPAAAEAQNEKIETFYERQGFDATTVTLETEFNEKKKIVDLTYHVKKGAQYRIEGISVEGNTVFPAGYFNSQINTLLLYKPTRFRKALDDIRKDYRKRGYLGARVRVKDFGRDEALKTLNPVLEIHQGKHVSVSFEGNRRVTIASLKKNMPMFTDGGYGRYEIESSQKAIADYYRRRGFSEIQVDVQDEKKGEDELTVAFKIREGAQTRVKTVTIEGGREIKDLKKELATKENSIFERGYYQAANVERDFQNLPLLMRDRGALSARALDRGAEFNSFRDKAHVTYSVDAGPISTVNAIIFDGNREFSGRRLRRRIHTREKEPFRTSVLQQDREALLIYYADRGYPYATAEPEFRVKSSEVVFHIQEGPETKIGEVVIVGNERTLKRDILRAMRIRPGDRFSYKRILESESFLRRSGAFRSVTIQTIGLTERQPMVSLVVKLEEYRKIVMDFGVTYDTDNFFTGDLNITHLNLGGTIRRGNFRLIGGRDIQKGEITLKDPFFLGRPFEASISTFLERDLKPGFKTVEGGGSLNFLREFTPQISLLGRYELIRTFFTDVTDETGAAEEDHTTSKFSFSFSYDKRDSYSDPHKGFIGFAGLDISNKLIASTFNFLQPKGFIAHYLPIGNRVTWLNFARMEGIKVFGGDTLTRDERLFLGGDYSIRGFDEDAIGGTGTDGRPLGGQLLVSYTSELQVKLFSNFKFAAFLDNGSLTNDFEEIGTNSWRHSAGAGLRYITPVGPLRLDYAFKLDKKDDESTGRFHLAFGYAF